MITFYHWYVEYPRCLEHYYCWWGLWGSNDGLNRWPAGAGFSQVPVLSVHESHDCLHWRQCWTTAVKHLIANGDIRQQSAAVVDLLYGKNHCVGKSKLPQIYSEKIQYFYKHRHAVKTAQNIFLPGASESLWNTCESNRSPWDVAVDREGSSNENITFFKEKGILWWTKHLTVSFFFHCFKTPNQEQKHNMYSVTHLVQTVVHRHSQTYI